MNPDYDLACQKAVGDFSWTVLLAGTQDALLSSYHRFPEHEIAQEDYRWAYCNCGQRITGEGYWSLQKKCLDHRAQMIVQGPGRSSPDSRCSDYAF